MAAKKPAARKPTPKKPLRKAKAFVKRSDIIEFSEGDHLQPGEMFKAEAHFNKGFPSTTREAGVEAYVDVKITAPCEDVYWFSMATLKALMAQLEAKEAQLLKDNKA